MAEDILNPTPSAAASGGVWIAQTSDQVNEPEAGTPVSTPAGQAEGQAPDGAGADAPRIPTPSQPKPSAKASGRSGKTTSKEKVPPAAAESDVEGTPHVQMMAAIRATLYPAVSSCVEPVEKQIAQASKQFRAAGFQPDDIHEIHLFVKRVDPWRHSITPSTLVSASAKWASEQALNKQPAPTHVPTPAQPAVKKGFLR